MNTIQNAFLRSLIKVDHDITKKDYVILCGNGSHTYEVLRLALIIRRSSGHACHCVSDRSKYRSTWLAGRPRFTSNWL